MMPQRISQLLTLAHQAHQSGQLALAEEYYARILEQQAHHFDALHAIGVIAHQRGDHESALQFYGKALQIDSKHSRLYHNLASCLIQLGRDAEALLSVDAALELDAHYVMAWITRGRILCQLSRFADAMQAFEKAMEIQIDACDAYYERGICLQFLDMDEDALLDFDDALNFSKRQQRATAKLDFARALSLQKLGRYDASRSAYMASLDDPAMRQKALFNLALLETKQQEWHAALNWVDALLLLDIQSSRAHLQRGHILRQLDRIDEAAAAFRAAGTYGLDPGQLEFLLASLGLLKSPSSAPSDYVRDLFDHYAPHFDQHLSLNLEYRLPEILQSRFQQYLDHKLERMLDLGCGTGLCGSLLRSYGEQLIGVDLSSEMLARAKSRLVYDELICDELIHYLELPNPEVDLILLADVLVYIGDLNPLFERCTQRLKTGGVLFFTVELLATNKITEQERGYTLQSNQRYAHQSEYLQALARKHCFEILEATTHVLRREGEQQSTSLVCIWRKPQTT